jgi:hypothetical protein
MVTYFDGTLRPPFRFRMTPKPFSSASHSGEFEASSSSTARFVIFLTCFTRMVVLPKLVLSSASPSLSGDHPVTTGKETGGNKRQDDGAKMQETSA